MKTILALLMSAFLLCGFSDSPPEPSFEIVSFQPYYKSCRSTTCDTYMESVVNVHNNSEYPVDITLTCIYYTNGELHSNVNTELKLDIDEKRVVRSQVVYTGSADDVFFYSIWCGLQN